MAAFSFRQAIDKINPHHDELGRFASRDGVRPSDPAQVARNNTIIKEIIGILVKRDGELTAEGTMKVGRRLDMLVTDRINEVGDYGEEIEHKDAVLSVLSSVRSMGVESEEIGWGKKKHAGIIEYSALTESDDLLSVSFEDAKRHYPTEWFKAAEAGGIADIKTTTGKTASHYLPGKEGGSIRVRVSEELVEKTPTGGAKYKTILSPDWDAKGAVRHELGHYMEDNVPGLSKIVNDHINARTAGKGTEQLGLGYRSNDITREGGFFNKYCGRVYPGTNPNGTKPSEFLSMAMQHMFLAPGSTERMKKDDPQTYYFTLGLLAAHGSREAIGKYNAYHDEKGRFSTADRSASFSLGGTAAQRAKAIEREKTRNPGWEEKPKPPAAAKKPRAPRKPKAVEKPVPASPMKERIDAAILASGGSVVSGSGFIAGQAQYSKIGKAVAKEVENRLKEVGGIDERDAITHVLQSVRPFGAPVTKNGVGAFKSAQYGEAVQTAMLEAAKYYPSDWHKTAGTATVRSVSTQSADGRAYYSNKGKFMAVPVETVRFLETQTGRTTIREPLMPSQMANTMGHEMGHHFEHNTPGLQRVLNDHYNARTAREAAKPMGPGYGAEEITRKDGFFRNYLGKVYKPDAETGLFPTEILSTSAQYMFKDPWSVRDIRINDPDTYHFTLGLLAAHGRTDLTVKKGMPGTFAGIVEKYNAYHDAKGRFSTADAAASFSLGGTAAQREKAIARERERTTGGTSSATAVEHTGMPTEKADARVMPGWSPKAIDMMGEENLKEYDSPDKPNKYAHDDDRWGTEPGEYTVYRSGNLDRRIIFTANEFEGAASYARAFEGDVAVNSYTVKIERPFVSTDRLSAYVELFGKRPKVEPSVAQIKAGVTVGTLWVKADERTASALAKKGYDAWLMKSPAPPAKKELVLLKRPKMTETSRRVPPHVKKRIETEASKDGYFANAMKDGKFTMTVDEWWKTDKYRASVGKAATFEQVVEKYNPYHDQRGRFASADSAISFSLSGGQRAKAKEQARTASDKTQRQTAPPSFQGNEKELDKPKIQWVQDNLGVSEETAKSYVESVWAFTGNLSSDMRSFELGGKVSDAAVGVETATKNLHEFMDNAPKHSGRIVRGVGFVGAMDDARAPQEKALHTALTTVGTVLNGGGSSSWTTDNAVSMAFATVFTNSAYEKKGIRPVQMVLEKPKDGVFVGHIGRYKGEGEVIMPHTARLEVVRVETKTFSMDGLPKNRQYISGTVYDEVTVRQIG